ncbi:MAG: nitroreductase family protein [Acidobacteriota bacterium]
MHKPAVNDYPIHDLLQTRWSPRAFDPERDIDTATLASLFEAARWAPSSFNEQPWAFLVASRSDRVSFDRLLDCLMPGNRAWAEYAPILIAGLAKNTVERNGKPNRYAWYDLGQAVSMLTVEATAHGLWLHQMAGFDADAVRRAHDVPEGWDPVVTIALGHQATSTDHLPEKLRDVEKAPRKRKPLDAFVFSGQFGDSAPWTRDG